MNADEVVRRLKRALASGKCRPADVRAVWLMYSGTDPEPRVLLLELLEQWILHHVQARTPFGLEDLVGEFPEVSEEGLHSLFQDEVKRRRRRLEHALRRRGRNPAGHPHLPGFTEWRFLGEGGMGQVWAAVREGLGEVAVKIPHPHILDRVGRKQFLKEAQAMALLNHPNLCRIHDAGDSEAGPYLFMQLIRGKTLEAWVSTVQPTASQLAQVLAEVALALEHMHAQGLAHRDVKPHNIMIENGCPVLIDFGFAAQTAEDEQGSGQMGTLPFMAPELFDGGAYGPRTDVYALGATLYTLCVGHRPFEPAAREELIGQIRTTMPTFPKEKRKWSERGLRAICLKALAKNPVERYETAGQMAAALRRFADRSRWLARQLTGAAIGLILALLIATAAERFQHLRQDLQGAEQVRRVDTLLAQASLTEAEKNRIEELLQELDRAHPDRAKTERLKYLTKLLTQGRLVPDDVTRMNRAVDLLGSQDPEQAARLRLEVAQKVRDPVELRNLPADQCAQAFTPEDVQFTDGLLVPRSSPDTAGVARVLSQEPSLAHTEMTVQFHYPSWTTARHVGVLLNADPHSDRGYRFVLRTLAGTDRSALRARAEDASPSFASALATQAKVALEIWRDDVLLQQQVVSADQLKQEKLTLLARRDGDRLLFQVNHLHPLRCRDCFPLSARRLTGEQAGPSFLGLLWPAGVGLVQFQVMDWPLQPAASPLELGDTRFHEGRYEEALKFFRDQASRSRSGPHAREAVYKAGLCLLRANRMDEAVRCFASLLQDDPARQGEEERHWSTLAAFQCVLLRGRRVAAETVRRAEKLLVDVADEGESKFDNLAAQLTEDERHALLKADTPYSHSSSLYYFLKPDPQRLANLERAVRIQDRAAPSGKVVGAKPELLRAYFAENKLAPATDLALNVLEQRDLEPLWRLTVLRDYVWLAIQSKATERLVEALRRVDEYLADRPERHPVYQSLLVEKARLLAVLEQPAEAEAALGRYFSPAVQGPLRLQFHARTADPSLGDGPPENVPVLFFLDACLLHGFLRHLQGDADGARHTWEEGFLKTRETPAGSYYEAAVLGSLCERLEERDAATMVLGTGDRSGMSRAARALKAAVAQPYLPFLATILRRAWQSDLGHDYARRIAFRDLSFREFTRVQVRLWFDEGLRLAVLGTKDPAAKLDPRQSVLLRQLLTQVEDFYVKGALSEDLIYQLATTLGTGAGKFKQWTVLAGRLPRPLHGPVAYVLGRHYLVNLDRPDEAQQFFAEASKAAQHLPPDSCLRLLTAVETQRAKP